MSPAWFGWAVPVILAPVALYFSLRRRDKRVRQGHGVQMHSRRGIVIAAVASLPLVPLLVVGVVQALQEDPLLWFAIVFIAALLVAVVVQLVRASLYRLEVVGDAVRVTDLFLGQVTVRPGDIDRVVGTELRGGHFYSVELKNGKRITLNASEFDLGPLRRTLEAKATKAAKVRSKKRGNRRGAERATAGAGGSANRGPFDAVATVAPDAEPAERLRMLAREVEAAGADRIAPSSRGSVARELNAAAGCLPDQPGAAQQQLRAVQREMTDTWPLNDELAGRVLATVAEVLRQVGEA